MKQLLQKISWRVLEKEITRITKRFPLTVTALLSIATILVLMVADPHAFEESFVGKMIITLTLVVWLSLVQQLIHESFGWDEQTRGYGWIVTVLVACGYWATLPQDFVGIYGEFFITHIAIHASLVLTIVFGLGIGQWWQNKYQNTRFYNLIIMEGMYVIQSCVMAIIFLLAGLAVIGTIDVLFDPSWWNDDPYFFWLIISTILVGPMFFLARYPETMPEEISVGERFLHFLVKYIALPFICIYFVILYAYTAKVLINFTQWPEGVVAWLVIWFSIFGYVTYILSYHLRDISWVGKIRFWTPILLLPQLAMLFYAIGLRINQHGWTVNRYLVVAFGVWLLILSIYFIWKKHQSQLIMIPASLFVAIMVVLVGPWGMFAVSERSQLHKLEYLMNLDEMTDTQENHAASAITYLCKFHGCQTVYQSSAISNRLDEQHDHHWEIINDLGLNDEWNNPYQGRKYYNTTYGPWNVDGFSQLVFFDSYAWSDRYAQYDVDSGSVTIDDELQIPIEQYVLDLRDYTNNSGREINKDQSIFTMQHKGTQYRVFITSFAVQDETVVEAEGAIAY